MDSDIHGEDEMPDMDDLRGDNPPTCKACGVPLIDHIGHAGLCARLQAARAALRQIAETRCAWQLSQEIARDGLEASE